MTTSTWKQEAERRAKGYWAAWQKFPIAMSLAHGVALVAGFLIGRI